MDIMQAFSADNVRFVFEGFYMTLKVAAISIVFSFIVGCIVGTIRIRSCRCFTHSGYSS